MKNVLAVVKKEKNVHVRKNAAVNVMKIVIAVINVVAKMKNQKSKI